MQGDTRSVRPQRYVQAVHRDFCIQAKGSGLHSRLQVNMIPGSQFAHLRLRFAREDWNVGVLSQPVEDFVQGGIRTPIRWRRTRSAWEMFMRAKHAERSRSIQ